MTSSVVSADIPAWNTSTIALNNDSRSVPDDWDNDEPAEESAKEIWDRANTAAPMPQIQMSSQSTNLPPVAAIMPSMRILQRPKSTSASQSGSNPTPASTKSLQEREADYKAARERIFASSGGGSSASSSREASPAPKRGILNRGRGGHGGNGHRKGSPGTPEGSVGAGVTREPHGAQDGRGFAPRGRRGRGGGRGGSSQ
ncbi:SUZ domain protein [Rhizoctonia solani]|uniref:SUZ domain protein n=1 Tax=Rhizoctonia solani TaxID=456999 RepID=A0A8H8P8X2_9AGAM|nr:SUZ domain protein [Rhizoctonia solani]QRW25971.1 SUZ domain protein [Rhizoctonia solani]